MQRRKKCPPLLCKYFPRAEESVTAENVASALKLTTQRRPLQTNRLWIDANNKTQHSKGPGVKQTAAYPVLRMPPPVVPLTPVRQSKGLSKRHSKAALGQHKQIDDRRFRQEIPSSQFLSTPNVEKTKMVSRSSNRVRQQLTGNEPYHSVDTGPRHKPPSMHRSMSLTHNLDKCETRLNKSEGIFVSRANREQLSVSGYSLSRSLSVNRVETANSEPEMLPWNASLRPSFQRSQSVNAVRNPTVYSVSARVSYPGRSLTGSTSVKRHKQKKESGASTDVCEEFHKSGNSVKDLSQEKQSHRCSRFICWLLFPVMVTLLLGTLNAAYNVDLQAKLQGRTRFIASEALNLSTTGLKENFQEMVFGQHIVTEAVPQIITDYISSDIDPNPLVLSFHGWIGTGKTFVTDLIMEQLFKKQNLVKCTHRFVSSYDFPLQDRHDQYSARLMQVINSTALNHCKVRLIIFDEADAIPLGLIPTLVALFKDTAPGAGFGKGIYILESNLFGQEINRFLIHHVLQGKSLESVTASEITDFLYYTAVRQVDFHKPDMEGDDEFDSHRALLGHQQLESVIDYNIPFLPLTRDAVKQCVQRDLKQKRHEVTSSIVDQITEQLQFFPSNLRLFSVTGCKKVSPHVDLVVG